MTGQDILSTIKAHTYGGTAYTAVRETDANGRRRFVKKPYGVTHPKSGGVILLHDIHQRTYESMKLFLPWAKIENISFKSLNEVKEFSYANKLCELLL